MAKLNQRRVEYWLPPALAVLSTQCAGSDAKLNYGQANGFTCHSLRHTFVTDMMEATGNDVALVMSYSGHKSIESFKIYLHPTEKGRVLANQRMKVVGGLLGTCTGTERNDGASRKSARPLERRQGV